MGTGENAAEHHFLLFFNIVFRSLFPRYLQKSGQSNKGLKVQYTCPVTKVKSPPN